MKINKRPSLPFSYILIFSAIYLAISSSPPDMTYMSSILSKTTLLQGRPHPSHGNKKEEELMMKKQASNKARERSLTHL